MWYFLTVWLAGTAVYSAAVFHSFLIGGRHLELVTLVAAALLFPTYVFAAKRLWFQAGASSGIGVLFTLMSLGAPYALLVFAILATCVFLKSCPAV
jgi:hypothetical protein